MVLVSLIAISQGQELPTVYEYFGGEGPLTGLVAEQNKFWLNGKEIRIVSGAMHYFRIHPTLWRDRLKKLRAVGANTVETYVAWNLHEPRQDEYDFGDGDNDLSEFLNLRRFIEIAQEEDLLVLFRPGPYICSEWEFGGLPSWLQRDPEMKVRTAYQPYLDRVKKYFDKLLPLVTDLQFTKGGSIIGIQIENEYASFNPIDLPYLEFIKQLYEDHGFADSLFFTSDNTGTATGSLPGILMTANFQVNAEGNLNALRNLQPDKPLMVMEFWSGWFDHWFESHNSVGIIQFGNVLETILGNSFNSSVNFYMFHGGTNFGFQAGANNINNSPYYHADITSYDYDAPLSEAGDYMDKYHRARELIEIYQVPQLHRPEMIPESVKVAYPSVQLQNYLTYEDMLDQIPSSAKFVYQKPVSMENLPMNGDNGPFSGQSYGYIIYRKTLPISNGSKYKTSKVRDFGMLLVDGKVQETDYWINSEKEITLQVEQEGEHTVDLLVENMGRVNFGWENDFLQQRGLPNGGSIMVDDNEIEEIEVFAAEFKSKWVKGLQNWKVIEESTQLQAPCLIQSTFEITGEPADTFLDMTLWHKGVVFINGFNLGRYFKVGPPQTLYIPAALLQTGTNTLTIFEQFQPASEITFRDTPILFPTQRK